MDEWKKWAKVSRARSGAANTKRYHRVKFWGQGTLHRLLGEPDPGTVCLGSHRIGRSTLRELAEEFGPRRSMMRGVALVAAEPFKHGLRYIHQSYVLGAQTGTPRFYGERW